MNNQDVYELLDRVVQGAVNAVGSCPGSQNPAPAACAEGYIGDRAVYERLDLVVQCAVSELGGARACLPGLCR
ncbi:MAG: hypothetical protein K8963_09610 [Proteobacteria bacterium]|nr:hypothetical protein [Pseudomonadota bacterium]